MTLTAETASGFYYWFEPQLFQKVPPPTVAQFSIFRIGCLTGVDDCCEIGLRSLTWLFYRNHHKRSFRRAWGLSPPKRLIIDNIFFETELAHDTYCISWYIIITKLPSLSVRYARRLIACRLQSYSLRAYCQNKQSSLFWKNLALNNRTRGPDLP